MYDKRNIESKDMNEWVTYIDQHWHYEDNQDDFQLFIWDPTQQGLLDTVPEWELHQENDGDLLKDHDDEIRTTLTEPPLDTRRRV